MGLFDEVKATFFCFYCGAEMRDSWWQTKDTECLMVRFDSLDEMYGKFPEIGYFDLIGKCDNCQELPRIQTLNTSKAHKDYMDNHWKQTRLAWSKEALKEHPDHGDGGWRSVWCPKCPKDTQDEADDR
jgi:hypothetical protein